MTISLIRILAITIFIAHHQKKNILVTLLNDYAKTKLTIKQFLLLKILVGYYKDTVNIISKPLFNSMNKLLLTNSNSICKNLLYS
jgi:hypothetical protein